jgi:opacity protein-like surface antigen
MYKKLFSSLLIVMLLASVLGSIAFAANPENMFGSKTGSRYTDGIAYELGTKFQADVAGKITGVRVYGVSGESGNHTVRIWNNATGQVVGGPYTWNFSGSNSWVTYTLPQPVSISANTQYTVSVSTGTDSAKYYTARAGDFASPGNNGSHLSWPADAGVYTTSLGTRPTTTYNHNNYLRDVVFEPDSGNPPPTGDPNFFPIGVWLQSPSNAAGYSAMGINTYIGL